MRETFKFLAIFQSDGSVHLVRVEEPVASRYDVLLSAIHVHDEKFLAGVYIAKNNNIGDRLTNTQRNLIVDSVFMEVNKTMNADQV
ncbi:hypothetical protein ANRL4_01285 [Anaerolineae bacterium]|nr:hypothetical protein ANRL4_01285 [Anaerolineae bacterium]